MKLITLFYPQYIYLLILLFFTFPITFSQIIFEKTYGGVRSERGTVIELTDDNGYIISASTSSFTNNQDMYLLKIDELGAIEWSKVYSSPESLDRLHGVKQISGGGYYVSGYIEGGFGFVDHAIMRVDESGSIIWAKNFGGVEAEELREVSITPDDGILVSDYNASFGAGAKDVQAIKFSSSGILEWAKTYGFVWEDFNATSLVLNDGNFLLVGETDISGFYDVRPLLIKTDDMGNILWSKVYSGTIEDWTRFAVEDDDGGFLIVGDTRSYGLGGSKDIFVFKTDSTGTVLWAKAYGGINDETGYGIEKTSDGQFVVAGYTNSFGFGNNDAFLMKVDQNGNLNWFYTYGGFQDDYIYTVKETPDSGFVMVGRRYSNSLGSDDIYVLKSDKFGMTGCDFTIPNVNVFNIQNLQATDYSLATLDLISVSNLTPIVSSPNVATIITCGTVPVELTSFNCTLENNNVDIVWSTATEKNNKGFKILKNNTEIAFVQGAGTTTEPQNYLYEDNSVANGNHIYALIQVDYDGTTENLGSIEIIVNNIPSDFILEQNFPNPFNPITTINYSVPIQSHISVIIYNNLGEKILTLVDEYHEPGYYQVDFDAVDFPSGLYLYSLMSEGYTATKKMLLLK